MICQSRDPVGAKKVLGYCLSNVRERELSSIDSAATNLANFAPGF